jgi:hypothetical protein
MRLALAHLAAEVGERDETARHLAVAERCFRQLDVPRYLEKARHLATELGVTLAA